MIIKIILILLFSYIVISMANNFIFKSGNFFDMYVGVPGSGKTTFAAYLAKKRLKKWCKQKKHSQDYCVLSNVPIKGANIVIKEDIGQYEIQNCLLIMDEAGIDYNNRNFKNFSDNETYFYKFHRHYNVDVAMFSQDFDVDLKLRKLSTRLWIVNRSFFPGFIHAKQVKKFIGIDTTTKQLVDQYEFVLFGGKYIFAPKLWKMFNTFDRRTLPKKSFPKYE